MAGYDDAEALALRLSMPQVQGYRGLTEFANKLGAPQAGLAGRAGRALTGETARDRGDHALNTALGIGTGIGPVSSALGVPNAIALPSDKQGDVPNLSSRAQQQMKIDDLGQSTPMRTPGVDIQPAQTLASQEKPKPSDGGGGMGGGGGLMAALGSARQQGLRDMEQERDLTGQLGVEKAGRIMSVADLQEQEAMRQQRAAEDQQRVDAAASERLQAFIAKNTERAEELAQMKTDPGRLLRNADTQTKFSMSLGASLAGGLAAMNGTNGNSSLDRVERLIAQDIKSQEDAIDNKKSSLNARNSIFGQMLQETGDRRLAAQQTRVMMLEGAKLKLQADADRLGIPEVRTNAELATNAIQQKIDQAKTKMAEDALIAFQRQAAAGVAAQRAAEDRARAIAKEQFEMGLKRDEFQLKAYEAGIDPATGKPIPGTTSKAAKEAAKEDNEKVGTAVKQLADDQILANRELINRMAKNIREDGSIVGFDATARAKAGAAKGFTFGLASDELVKRFALTDPERISQKDWQTMALAFQTKVTGTGGSDEQMKKIGAAFEGAGTAAERRKVIMDMKNELARREALAYGNLTDAQKAELERRLARDGQK